MAEVFDPNGLTAVVTGAAPMPLPSGVLAETGGVDILVNNAGAARRRRMQKITPAEFDATMAINFTSPMRLTLALLPHMIERGSGHIVNVGSSGTRKFAPRRSASNG